MPRMLTRARSAIRRHGFTGLIPLFVKNARHVWRTIQDGPQSTHSTFDEQFHLETERISEIGSLDIKSPNSKYAVRYQPSPPELVREILSRLAIGYGDFTFVDFGAGKGRVLLIASEFPFSRIAGIEFSPELVKAAQENIKSFRSPRQQTTQIDVVHADVVNYEVPEVPLVCYFYNPFQWPIMEQVASRLGASSKSCQRDIYVVYVQPEHRDVFDKSDAWMCYIDDPLFVVYRSQCNIRQARCV